MMRIRVRTRLVSMVAIVCCASAFSQTPALRAERDLLASINATRRSQGLSSLRWDESLATAARRHAEVMAEHRSTGHAFEGEPSLSARAKQAGAHFTWLSEKVEQGPSPEFIHSQFMKSPSHRANILERDMNAIGVGVVEKHGQLFAVEDFAQLH